jgi:hypothetical protein
MRLRAAIFLLCFAATAAASTLADYKQRLGRASDEVVKIRNAEDHPGGPSAALTIASIIQFVPVTERVEWPGGSVETDNAWLTAALDNYKAEPTRQKRAEILAAIRERLEGESKAIAELQYNIAGESTKDSDKQKLAEILSRPEYQPPAESDESLFQKWWREFWEWIDGLFPRPKIEPSNAGDMGSLRIALQLLIFAAVAALLVFILWRFLPYFRSRFQGRKERDRPDRVILGEIVSSDESASDIFAEAERLAREGDIRGAIRKGYIAVLCELGDRHLLRLARHKTNLDYLRDVRRTPVVFDELRALTDTFERNWYGARTASLEDWRVFREGYNRTLKEERG